jgi:hypothetical protein
MKCVDHIVYMGLMRNEKQNKIDGKPEINNSKTQTSTKFVLKMAHLATS